MEVHIDKQLNGNFQLYSGGHAFRREVVCPYNLLGCRAVALEAPRGRHDHAHILLGWLLVYRLFRAAQLSKNALESGLSAV